MSNPAGWQPDPTGRHEHRYWDGNAWTDHVADGGVSSTDPYDAAGAGAGDATAATPAPTSGWDAPPPAPETGAGDPTVAETAPISAVPPPDPTTAWGATSAMPPVPGPGPASTPAPAGSGGGNKTPLIIGGIVAIIAVVAGLFFFLGGDDDDKEDVRARLAAQIAAEGEFTEREPECLADKLVDELGEDVFEGYDFSSEDPPPGVDRDEATEAFLAAFEACDIDIFGGVTPEEEEGGDDDEGDDELADLREACADGDFAACDDLWLQSPIGSDDELFGSTCGGVSDVELYGDCEMTDGGRDLPDDADDDLGIGTGGDLDFGQLMAEQFEAMGLDPDKAQCLGQAMAADVESGAIDENSGAGEFMRYLDECDLTVQELAELGT